MFGDNLYFEYPFVPYSVSDPAGCSDASDYFVYQIEMPAGFAGYVNQFKLSADQYSNVIRLETGPAATTLIPQGPYIFTVKGVLPNRQVFSWELTIGWSQCHLTSSIIVPSPIVDQSYIITTPLGFYEVSQWTLNDAACNAAFPDWTYYNEITPLNTWITGVTDFGGIGRRVEWETFDEANKGVYTVTITG